MRRVLNIAVAAFVFSWLFGGWFAFLPPHHHVEGLSDITPRSAINPADTPVTPKPKVKVRGIPTNPLDRSKAHPLQLKDPKNVTTEVVYDPVTNSYQLQRKIGNTPYGPPTEMTVGEYLQYDMDAAMRKYWRERAGVGKEDTGSRGFLPEIRIPGEVFEDIFGSSKIDIRPTGSIEMRFGIEHNRTDNKNLAVNQRRQTRFDFDEDIQLSLKASIGDKIHYDMNFKSKQVSLLDENKFKLNYEGKEDEIIKLLEFGNINMPLTSTLIEGSQNLFGAKVQTQFGKLMLTTVVSQKKGDKRQIQLENGSEYTEYEFKADDYEEDKHFFIAQYFYEHYAEAMKTLPLINSRITITRIEVWKTNIGSAVEQNRNIIAITDLGEANPYNRGISSNHLPGGYPDSNANDFLQGIDYSQMRGISNVSTYLKTYRGGMTSGVDFEKIESARLLTSNEYTFNPKLGFISLNTRLNSDQVLAVAFQYTINGDPNVYQVGQFSNEVVAPGCIIVKLLRSTAINTQIPLWKLMMKNVYSLGAYQVSNEDFRLNVLYKGEDDGVGKGYFTNVEESLQGVSLIRILGLDRLNSQLAEYPDGVFDFIDKAATEGGTIQSESGKIFFPTPEPFGKDLREALKGSPGAGDLYAYDSLYSLTKTLAQQYSNRNKFYLEGRYKSSYGADISLGAYNVSPGSVTVLAGGIVLTEGTDYTVDYTAGTVRIINENYLQSGTPITVSVESENSLGTTQTMIGLHADYNFSKNFMVGATLLNLSERSETFKVNFGEEPINNTIWGFNTAFERESQKVTDLLNYLPNYSTKQISTIKFDGEFAQFLPGYSRSIGKKESAALYIDDFEAAQTSSTLTTVGMWHLASTPQNQTRPGMFPEAAIGTGLQYGFNRALLSWYVIDPLFHNNSRSTPDNITSADKSDMYARRVLIKEVFPYRSVDATSEDPYLSVFNLAFYPSERGPYNFDTYGVAGVSSGLNADGTLKNPSSRWGGIMRKLDNTNFEVSNVEYLEFWMMDPFYENPTHSGGQLYINLGDISEDILRDGRKSFEHGLPEDGSLTGVDTTIWGRVPLSQSIVTAFSTEVTSRKYQDVGYDGLQDEMEKRHYANYLATVKNILSPAVYAAFEADPSADNYHYFRGSDYDGWDYKITRRYKYFNNTEGNSPTDSDNPESYPTQSSSMPNMEDINNDNTLNEDERYYQYVINLSPDKMKIGKGYITDVMENNNVQLDDGSTVTVKWYQFKVPVKSPDAVIGNLHDFSSIRFIRMFLKGFSDPVVLRFATLELVRGDWRTCTDDLKEDGEYFGDNTGNFSVSTLNLEENYYREPVPYRLPGGLEREKWYTTTSNVSERNEQSLVLKALNIMDGDARAVYKNCTYDLRRFGELRFYLHAENVEASDNNKPNDMTFFIRLGTDATNNYYEYEIPLVYTPWYTTDTSLIWPVANKIAIHLQQLIDAKQERNIANRSGSSYPINERYAVPDGERMIYVKGNPNLADVNVILMGLRNPKKRSLSDDDDMLPKSVEVWVNELRLGDFDESSGWAARGNLTVNLADLGDVAAAACIKTAGFGPLESTTYGRQDETTTALSFATNLEMGKLLPSKWNVSIPLHYDYSRNAATPEYNTLNPDVKLKEDLKTYATRAERDSIKAQNVDLVTRHNFNIVNLRKNRGEGKDKSHLWDIENFYATYAYTQEKRRDEDYEYDDLHTHKGVLGYSYSANPKNYKPFENLSKSKALKLITDFNFYLLPKSFSFNTEMYRTYNESKLRNRSAGIIITDPMFTKNIEWSRDYDLTWDLTQSLKMTFSAQAEAVVDEPQGRIDTREKKDSIWRNVATLGRMNLYNQRFNVSYQLPINKLPGLSWITSSVRYGSTYGWTAAAPAVSYVGNDVENSNSKQFTLTANFTGLYNKSKYLQKVNRGTFGSSLHDKPILKSRQEALQMRTKNDSAKTSAVQPPNIGKEILDNFLRLAMLLKNASFSYTEGNATLLPGFMFEPDAFGVSFSNSYAPGFGFVFGAQGDVDALAMQNSWLTTSQMLNDPFQQRTNTNMQFQVTMEPMRDFRIRVTGNRVYSNIYQYNYLFDSLSGTYGTYTAQRTGNFSISTIGLSTFFVKDGARNTNAVFEQFKTNRRIIADRLADYRSSEQPYYVRGNGDFPDGYGSSSQDVLSYAFLSAYLGKDPYQIGVSSPFMKLPLPNWNISYNGLSRIPGLDKVFQSVTLSHAYTCVYQIGSYATNLVYNDAEGSLQSMRDALDNFISQYEFGQMSLTENMNPIVGVDVKMKNNFQFKTSWKKSRTVTLSTAAFQITEMTNNEFVIGAGYRFKDLKVTYNFAGVRKQSIADLVLNVSVSLRDSKTMLRKIEEDLNLPSAGQKILYIDFTAEYQLTKEISLAAFYEHTLTTPVLSSTYKNLRIESGISLKINFSQL